MKTNTVIRALTNRRVAGAGTSSQPAEIALQQLVNQLLSHSMSAAFRNKTLVVNEVSREIFLSKDSMTQASVMRNLFETIISNSRNGEIYISADRFRDIIILQVQERNNYNGYALSSSLHLVEEQATLAGGEITVDGAQQRVVTISFSFPAHSHSFQYEC